jgi:HK97 family phage portal protein
MKVILGKGNKVITGYEYGGGLNKQIYKKEDIIRLRRTDPNDLIYGRGVISHIIDTINTDHKFRIFQQAMLDNAGVLSLFFSTDQKLTKTQFEEVLGLLKQQYAGGPKAGTIGLSDKGLTVQDMGQSPKDMHFTQGRLFTRDEIAAAFHIPVALLAGEKSIYTGKGLESAIVSMARFAVQPRLAMIEGAFNHDLSPDFDENLFIAFDSSVPEDREEKRKDLELALKFGVLSPEQVSDMLGYEAPEWGSTFPALTSSAGMGLPLKTVKKKPLIEPNDGSDLTGHLYRLNEDLKK